MGGTPVSPLNPDQEIRVIALEYASKLSDYNKIDVDDTLSNAGKIEKFIKEGHAGP